MSKVISARQEFGVAPSLGISEPAGTRTHGYDKYKRTLGDVILPDGTNINHALVKDGWYWWDRKHAPGDTVLEGLEHETRDARKGLWADLQPVPPWEVAQLQKLQPLAFRPLPVSLIAVIAAGLSALGCLARGSGCRVVF